MTPAHDRGIVVRVPATSANVGAGFDVLGIALDLHAELGSGAAPAGAVQLDEHHPATVAHRGVGGAGPIWLRSSIPIGRGLGFSGAARVGGAALGVAARGDDPVAALVAGLDEVLDVASGLEGHGDNAAASVAGGVVAWLGDRFLRLRVGPQLAGAAVVLWIPDATTSTDRSRAALPATVERVDVVHNLARVAQFVAAVEHDDPGLLRGATDDRIHQAIRLAAVDHAVDTLGAGAAAGAWCGWLSGSGPSLAFLAPRDRVAAVVDALGAHGHTKVLRIADAGVGVVSGDPARE